MGWLEYVIGLSSSHVAIVKTSVTYRNVRYHRRSRDLIVLHSAVKRPRRRLRVSHSFQMEPHFHAVHVASRYGMCNRTLTSPPYFPLMEIWEMRGSRALERIESIIVKIRAYLPIGRILELANRRCQSLRVGECHAPTQHSALSGQIHQCWLSTIARSHHER